MQRLEPPKLPRAFRKELRRILRRASRDPGGGDIHAVRKGITKLRSWLRLARKGIGSRRYRAHNRRLRQAARALAPIRDARVTAAALAAISSATSFPATRKWLRRQARHAKKAAAVAMRKVERQLTKEFQACRRLPLDKITAADFAVALERMREEMNVAFAAARGSGGVELLHTWRKRTKNYLHALAFVAGENSRRYQAAARINHLLGMDHDLALLTAKLVARRDNSENHTLLPLIAARRAKLRRQIFPKSRGDTRRGQ